MFQDEARFGRINDPKRCCVELVLEQKLVNKMVREYVHVMVHLVQKTELQIFNITVNGHAKYEYIFAELSSRHINEFIFINMIKLHATALEH